MDNGRKNQLSNNRIPHFALREVSSTLAQSNYFYLVVVLLVVLTGTVGAGVLLGSGGGGGPAGAPSQPIRLPAVVPSDVLPPQATYKLLDRLSCNKNTLAEETYQ